MTDIEARLIRIERVVENQSLVQLASELDRLRAESAALRGELETLRFESENSDSRQRELYVDVDRRLQSPRDCAARVHAAVRGIAAAGVRRAVGSRRAAVRARPAGSDQQNYEAAFDTDCRRASTRRPPPRSRRSSRSSRRARAPTTRSTGSRRRTTCAANTTRRCRCSARSSSSIRSRTKVPDALLKVGYCQIELGDRNAARTSLQEVMRQFPDTTAARLASQRLDRLSQ